jgi:SET domain-containing protein
MKFTGCSCSQGDSPCSQESITCLCKLLNRECDPDLCHTCGAIETANPFKRDQDPSPNSCCNTDIQRGVRKRLLVGESSHPGDIGFGAYMAEPAKQGEFIAEYVGEIISEAESVRRNEIYDKLKVSFIFDLNEEVTIDSFRYGNVERFINHSKKHANCKPVVKLVNGEHRIGFFATKDLAAGEELFFDYGKKFTAMHGLKEMEDMSKKKRVASKTGRGPSKGMRNITKEMRDMLKSVGNVSMEEDDNIGNGDDIPVVVYSFPDDDVEADEHEEEDPDDVRRPSRRPRRNVAKPKKYTR